MRARSNFSRNVKNSTLDLFEMKMKKNLRSIKFKDMKNQNLRKHQHKIVKELSDDRTIKIKPADKGGVIVIMNSNLYKQGCLSLLEDLYTYMTLDHDPTKETQLMIEEVVKKAAEEGWITDKTKEFLINKNPILPVFYGLPKVHKNLTNTPFRPIVAATESVYEALSRYLDRLLQPIVQSTSTYLRDNTNFLNILSTIDQIEEDWILFTLDSGGYDVDLFTVPPDHELLCPICHGVLRCPVMISCNHIFCKKCILQWLKRHHTCPCCRHEVRGKLLVLVHRLNKRINRLEIKCQYEQHGCSLRFPVARLDEHSSSCGFALLKCPNEDCPEEILRMHMEAHLARCRHWKQLCHMGCGTPLTVYNREQHNCYMELKEEWERKTQETRRMVARLKQKSRRIQSMSAQIRQQILLICESLDIPEGTTESSATEGSV
ncbi:RING finger protein 151 [Ambystoma mexicanum]|uniref:RING finger protein 151 n=1 Tax=Ambystoma mexicanum TaxID=8296 RepID=UPI0037E72227